MLSKEDKVWLTTEYPKLAIEDKQVSGLLEFTAAYNELTGQFFILNNAAHQEALGTVLSGTFQVYIRGRFDKEAAKLPTLHVDDLAHTPDKHFNQTDFSACLCSPLEEHDFRKPEFSFRKFVEELVVPFLYGQVFLATYGRWPWSEYAHGAAGLFEAYVRNERASNIAECVRRLSQEPDWQRIKTLLLQRPEVKGHTPCLCAKRDLIRRCHPLAWQGIRQLRSDLKLSPFSLP
jgi:hypothetical protein